MSIILIGAICFLIGVIVGAILTVLLSSWSIRFPS